MDDGGSERLVGTEIHGFHTLKDLDVQNMKKKAKSRWLRPDEIHAILCNLKHFRIYTKPVNLPKSGTIVLFDRKELRNFRKDGHNWKKNKDEKTVKEAHEHLKVGNEKRIHVYYAHGLDNPTFVRRCYWLLDKTLEHIVLVHYRDTKEGSPAIPETPCFDMGEFDSAAGYAYHENNNSCFDQQNQIAGNGFSNDGSPAMLVPPWFDMGEFDSAAGYAYHESERGSLDNNSCFDQQNQIAENIFSNDGGPISAYDLSTEVSLLGNLIEPVAQSNKAYPNTAVGVCNQISSGQVNSNVQWKDSSAIGTGDSLDLLVNDGLQSQETQEIFEMWLNGLRTEPPDSVGEPVLKSLISSGQDSFISPEKISPITEFSPPWAYSTEKTKATLPFEASTSVLPPPKTDVTLTSLMEKMDLHHEIKMKHLNNIEKSFNARFRSMNINVAKIRIQVEAIYKHLNLGTVSLPVELSEDKEDVTA